VARVHSEKELCVEKRQADSELFVEGKNLREEPEVSSSVCATSDADRQYHEVR
jgi:hypothetical protein